MMVTGPTLRKAMGGVLSDARYAQLAPRVNDALAEANCTTVKRAAMFLGQIAQESVGLRYMEEIASGAAYEGRRDLNNIYPGDGRRYKGRGPIQITGRHNYTALSRWAHGKGLAPTATYFVDHPAKLGTDQYAMLGPVWYWTVARPKLNAYADAGNLVAATRAINGGLNGLNARRTAYRRCLNLGKALLPGKGAGKTTKTTKTTKPSGEFQAMKQYKPLKRTKAQTIKPGKTKAIRLTNKGGLSWAKANTKAQAVSCRLKLKSPVDPTQRLRVGAYRRDKRAGKIVGKATNYWMQDLTGASGHVFRQFDWKYHVPNPKKGTKRYLRLRATNVSNKPITIMSAYTLRWKG